MSLASVFSAHAEFYRDRYVPFLIEEGFIESIEETEFGEGVQGFKPMDEAELASLSGSYRALLQQVGHGDIHFPTEEGPARFSVLAPREVAHWKSQLPSFLKTAGATMSTDHAVPFLVDAGGGILAFADAAEKIYVVSHTGKMFGPVPSMEQFFSTMFENAREHRLPFEGM